MANGERDERWEKKESKNRGRTETGERIQVKTIDKGRRNKKGQGRIFFPSIN